ncbi:Hypothetical predicted protein [Octopus vulgaris]|uniref:Uncharacterized protein n=1 Tax=Octopus vulgaris TaxID=6645 RepID=A0AA36B4N5_OCTVU|nr:Hypothetical predicted protein [Octopus vulgaris]
MFLKTPLDLPVLQPRLRIVKISFSNEIKYRSFIREDTEVETSSVLVADMWHSDDGIEIMNGVIFNIPYDI